MRADDRNIARIKHQQSYQVLIVWDLDRRTMLEFTDFGASARGFASLCPPPYTDQEIDTCCQYFV